MHNLKRNEMKKVGKLIKEERNRNSRGPGHKYPMMMAMGVMNSRHLRVMGSLHSVRSWGVMFCRKQQYSHKHLSRAVWILEMRIRGFKVANAPLGPLVSYQLCNDLDPGLHSLSHHVFQSRSIRLHWVLLLRNFM